MYYGGLLSFPIQDSRADTGEQLLGRLDGHFRRIPDMNAIIGSLFDFQFGPIVLNQVIDIVQVELDEADAYGKLLCMHSLLYGSKNMSGGPMEVTFAVGTVFTPLAAEYRMGFACACLPIG